MSEERSRGRVISIDEGLVKSQLGDAVRETVEQTLNKMLDAEADELCAPSDTYGARTGSIPGQVESNSRYPN